MHEIKINSKITSYQDYESLYHFSITQPEQFWDFCAKTTLDWFELYDRVYSGDITKFTKNSIKLENNQWFIGGKLNVSYNCLDRHLQKNADKIAYYWQGDQLEHCEQITYLGLYQKVCQFSNVLKKLGINKGDRVCIYLPLSIEAITAMLACTRIGAIHTVVFAGFSAHALANRIIDAECSLLVTTDSTERGGKTLDIWNTSNAAIELVSASYAKSDASGVSKKGHGLKTLLINNYYSPSSRITAICNESCINQKLYDYKQISDNVASECEAIWMDSEDPLFILYTSGSTGQPKGVLHTTAGYLLHASYSLKQIFDVKDNDIFWCTADVGWIAGHSYVVYGVLANAMSSVIYSGTPNYPDYDIFWQLIDKYKVNIFYTAPTALRALQKEGDSYLATTHRTSLRILGSVGETINPECWQWYYDKVGMSQCSIIDTWWQTETGAVMISPYANMVVNKPGCAMLPYMGVQFKLLNDQGEPTNERHGHLVITAPWPGMMRTVYNNHKKFTKTYLEVYQNCFYTGDIANIDKDNHYWLQGRSDDVINIAGHRLSTAEIESVMNSHQFVAESAAIAVPDEIKGEVLYAFVVLNNSYDGDSNSAIISQLKDYIRSEIGPIAIMRQIDLVSGLPKTRSGKIMRRILKKIAVFKSHVNSGPTINLDLGDTSTLTNPEIIKELLV